MTEQWSSLSFVLVGLLAAGCSDRVPITPEACAAQSDFALVVGGAFLSGSDRTEKDYAYRISVEGRTDNLADTR